jgi:hypothetical protein
LKAVRTLDAQNFSFATKSKQVIKTNIPNNEAQFPIDFVVPFISSPLIPLYLQQLLQNIWDQSQNGGNYTGTFFFLKKTQGNKLKLSTSFGCC